MLKVVNFGEIMLRLSTPDYQRFVQAETFNITYGGGEANVAVSLANLGLDSVFVTAVPDNAIGQAAINHLRRYGVETSHIKRQENSRLGIYFLESGASQRPSQVIYDRSNSSLATIDPALYDWDAVFSKAHWFHFTGITPALGDNATATVKQACIKAKEGGLTVSCDLNYRKKLWSRKKAKEVMGELMKYVDIVVANEEDAEQIFGIKATQSDVIRGDIDDRAYRLVAKELLDIFELKYVAITLRESFSASENGWSAILYDGSDFYKSSRYVIHIVDRVGGGDSFCGGLIYSLINNQSPQEAVEFASAASCLKQTIHGDFNMVNVKEVLNLVNGDASGRVQR